MILSLVVEQYYSLWEHHTHTPSLQHSRRLWRICTRSKHISIIRGDNGNEDLCTAIILLATLIVKTIYTCLCRDGRGYLYNSPRGGAAYTRPSWDLLISENLIVNEIIRSHANNSINTIKIVQQTLSKCQQTQNPQKGIPCTLSPRVGDCHC